MKIIKDLKQSLMKFFDKSWVRFLISGGVNTLLSYLLYLLALMFLGYLAAYSLSYLAGIFLGYFLNAIFVFRSRPALKTAALYPLVYLFQYVFGLGLLVALVEGLSLDTRFAPLLVMLISMPVMFLLNRSVFSRFG